MSARRRVVVTGMGLVSPLGVGVEHCWRRLLAGDIGVGALEGPEFADLPVRVAARVPGGPAAWQWDAARAPVPPAMARTGATRFVAFALAAAGEAMADAGLAPARGGGGGGAARFNGDRAGVAIGSGIGGITEIEAAALLVHGEGGYRRLSPFFVPRVLVNMAGGHVAMAHGLRGPCHAAATACATGGHSIGDGARFIAHGDADVMVVGGTDACISRLPVAGFARMKALAGGGGGAPAAAASRPFDAAAAGFVIGEGAGVLVLEEREHALARGARVLAEVAGYGCSGDAYHVCAPEPHGSGAARCMRAALADARLAPRDVAYINAHATSTELGDRAELDAVCAVFAGDAREGAEELIVSSTKGATGHLLGAAGAAEAIFAIHTLRTGTVPPSANLEHPLPAAVGVRIAPGGAPTALPAPPHAVMSNSFGFGGTNASLLFLRAE